MGFYIRDETVKDLATAFKELSGAENMTEAVRSALKQAIKRQVQKKPLLQIIREIQEDADELGEVDPHFDQKTFSDDLWS